MYFGESDDNDFGKPGDIYRSVGFIILHGTSHNAGFKHDSPPLGEGYCADAPVIQGRLRCPSSDCSLRTFEKIIIDTKKDYNYMIIQTNERYGYGRN